MVHTIPLRWLCSLAMALAVSSLAPTVAEETESKQDEEQAVPADESAAAEEAELAPSLRVEEGRVMTNRDAGPAAAPQRKVKLQDGMVITNDLLNRIVGPAPEAPSEVGSASADTGAPATPDRPAVAPADPMRALIDQQAAAATRQRRIAEAESDLEAAKTRLANLEVQLLAARNPFSKRPQLSDEEKEERRTSGETAAQRYERTQEQVEAARAEVGAAEELLAQLRAGS